MINTDVKITQPAVFLFELNHFYSLDFAGGHYSRFRFNLEMVQLQEFLIAFVIRLLCLVQPK